MKTKVPALIQVGGRWRRTYLEAGDTMIVIPTNNGSTILFNRRTNPLVVGIRAITVPRNHAKHVDSRHWISSRDKPEALAGLLADLLGITFTDKAKHRDNFIFTLG